MTRPPFTCRRDERGSISVWFAAASFAMVILVGLVVDVGGKVQAQQHARAAAAQAARAGAQEPSTSTPRAPRPPPTCRPPASRAPSRSPTPPS